LNGSLHLYLLDFERLRRGLMMKGVNPNDATLDVAHLLLPGQLSPEETEANVRSLELAGIVKREVPENGP